MCILLLASPVWAGSDARDLILSGRLGEALPAARLEAEAKPDDLDAQERYYDLLMSLGMAEVAVELARRRLAEAGEDTAARYLYGRVVPTAAAARAAYNQVLRDDPSFARAHMGLGAVERAEGRFELAIAAYRMAIAGDPSLGEAWAGLIAALLSTGKTDEALKASQDAMRAVPFESDAYIAYAVISPDLKLSVAALRRGAERVPNDPRIHTMLAELLLELGEGAEALEATKVALTANPNHSEALLWQLFARSLIAGTLDGAGFQGVREARAMQASDAKGALERWSVLVEGYRRCALVWMGRASVQLALGRTSEADGDLRRALELEPNNVEATAARGLLLLRTGGATDALPLLRRAALGRPEDASLSLAVGQAELAVGQGDAARQTFEKAIRRHPFDSRIPMMYAQILSGSGEREGAYQVLSQAAERTPEPRVLLALSAAARDAGYYEEAARAVEQIIEKTGAKDLQKTADRLRAMGG